jgi:hypothetical protein
MQNASMKWPVQKSNNLDGKQKRSKMVQVALNLSVHPGRGVQWSDEEKNNRNAVVNASWSSTSRCPSGCLARI